MKPIATLMKPLRSVDLTTLAEAPAAIERSDVCAVPAAAVVGEAMVAFVLADAFLEKFGGDSIDEIRAHYRATTELVSSRFTPRAVVADARSPHDSSDPALRRRRPACSRPRRSTEITPEIQQLIDDMIETMYAAPGIGLAATAGRRGAADLRRRRLGRPQRQRAAGVRQPRVRRARRHAARRRRLPERARLQRHRRPAVSARRQGLDRDGSQQHGRRHRACWRAASSTRWITSTARCSSIACAACRRI